MNAQKEYERTMKENEGKLQMKVKEHERRLKGK
jgi:hypothetical protein